MSALSDEKRALRRALRQRSLPEEERARLSDALCGHVLASRVWLEARCAAAFVPTAEEADIRPLLRAAARGKRLALPVTLPDRSIVFREAPAPEALVPDAYGIPAPPPSCPEIPAEEIDLMLLPLMAADRQGHRLGRGAGCYDRWLAAHPFTGCRMGIVLPDRLLDRVPSEPTDRPLDCLATPGGILPCDTSSEGA